MTDTTAAVAKLAKAKVSLILEHPFVGTVALNMPFEPDASIPTAATNGKRIKFNPEFINSMSDEEVKFVVAHECLHPMLEHTFRRNSRNPRKWNVAADYVINQLLVDEHIGRMPKMGLYDPNIYNAGNGTSEGIYSILPDMPDDEWCPGNEGDSLDHCEDAEGNPAEQAQQQAEMKVKVAQAAQAAKMMGKLSAGMARLVQDVLQPKVNWRDVLHRFLVRSKTDSRSFSRFNRRFLPQGIYLPSISGEQMGELCFGVDCSGSISQQEIDQYAAEIRTVKEDLTPTMVHILYFDSTVSHVETYSPDDDLNIQPHGGGGTAFSPVFSKIEEMGINPAAIVILTDLCCNDFGNPPDAPVLWVSTSGTNAPFGEVVRMTND